MSKRKTSTAVTTLAERIQSHLTVEEKLDVICHKTVSNVGDERTEEWNRYESLAELPNVKLDGWEELIVFTNQNIYRWVQVGFNSGPTRVPRSPDFLESGPL